MKKSVMIIEDDTEMAQMLELILGTQFEVIVCTERSKAVPKAKSHLTDHGAPDCMVIDLIINGTGGVDFYHWMKGQGFSPPVIFLTGCHQQSPEYRAAKDTGEAIYEKDYFSAKKLLAGVAAKIEDPSS
jgi:DNA-binding response OmpR family regulator